MENGLTCRNTDVSAFSCSLNALAPNEKSLFFLFASYRQKQENRFLIQRLFREFKIFWFHRAYEFLFETPVLPSVITKSPDKSILELNEEVTFTLVVTNRTRALTLQEVNILDDFPEDKLQIFQWMPVVLLVSTTQKKLIVVFPNLPREMCTPLCLVLKQ